MDVEVNQGKSPVNQAKQNGTGVDSSTLHQRILQIQRLLATCHQHKPKSLNVVRPLKENVTMERTQAKTPFLETPCGHDPRDRRKMNRI